MSPNRFIAITGGIGSGKSTVSRFWSAYAKLPLIDIDKLCRELLEVDMPGWIALKASLGNTYFAPDGQLNRKAFRSALFAESGLRQMVDQIIHPLAFDLFRQKTKNIEGIVLVDVPLLFEAGWDDQFNRTVAVFADRQTCCRRVCRRDKIPVEEAVKAISAQLPIEEKAMRADHVVDNRFCWLLTRIQVVHLAKFVRKGVTDESSGKNDSGEATFSVAG